MVAPRREQTGFEAWLLEPRCETQMVWCRVVVGGLRQGSSSAGYPGSLLLGTQAVFGWVPRQEQKAEVTNGGMGSAVSG